MSESKHTPGPWTLRTNSEKHHAILDEGGFPRAEVFSAHRSSEARKAEALANARLIAAAPELLEALKDVYTRRTDILNAANKASLGTGGLEFALRKTREAIAKAEGK
jgi:hypothetical protein